MDVPAAYRKGESVTSSLKSADAPTKQVERSVVNGKTDKRQIR
jgi:hypothetical protein